MDYKYINSRKRIYYYESHWSVHYYGIEVLFSYKIFGCRFTLWKNVYNHQVDMNLSSDDNFKDTLEGYKEFLAKHRNENNTKKLKFKNSL